MHRPVAEPIGLHLARTAKVVSRAFDDALAEAGGSRPVWLILVSLKSGTWATQRELAKSLGIEGATLTHHLDGLERGGLVSRSRDPDNRRVQRVELTKKGDKLFHRLRDAAVNFDEGLRDGISERDVDRLRALLGRLEANVTEDAAEAAPPRARRG
jgi:MarR family transcriptional regulator for hemolysin